MRSEDQAAQTQVEAQHWWCAGRASETSSTIGIVSIATSVSLRVAQPSASSAPGHWVDLGAVVLPDLPADLPLLKPWGSGNNRLPTANEGMESPPYSRPCTVLACLLIGP